MATTDAPLGPDPGRILGAEWAGKLPPSAGITDKREWGERTPCPICGHPTGDCVSDEHMKGPGT